MFINEDYERIKKEIQSSKSKGYNSICFWVQNPVLLAIDPTEKYRLKISDEIIDRLRSEGYAVEVANRFDSPIIVTISFTGE